MNESQAHNLSSIRRNRSILTSNSQSFQHRMKSIRLEVKFIIFLEQDEARKAVNQTPQSSEHETKQKDTHSLSPSHFSPSYEHNFLTISSGVKRTKATEKHRPSLLHLLQSIPVVYPNGRRECDAKKSKKEVHKRRNKRQTKSVRRK
jgi:hypothetical protein